MSTMFIGLYLGNTIADLKSCFLANEANFFFYHFLHKATDLEYFKSTFHLLAFCVIVVMHLNAVYILITRNIMILLCMVNFTYIYPYVFSLPCSFFPLMVLFLSSLIFLLPRQLLLFILFYFFCLVSLLMKK